jgi:hypothetical protein
MLDPSSPGNVIRDPQRSGFFPAHYNPPYGAPGYNPAYGQGYNYPVPAGPPPSGLYPAPPVDGKPPGYTGDGWEDMQRKSPIDEEDGTGPKTGNPHY